MKRIYLFFLLALSVFCGCSVEARDMAPSLFKWENDRRAAMKAFGPKFAQKHGCRYLNTGIGSVLRYHTELMAWDVNVTMNRKWTVEEARPKIVAMIDEFLTFIYTNPVFQTEWNEYIADKNKYRVKRGAKPLEPILTSQQIGIKLAFWDENVDRPHPPYIAEINVVNGFIVYFRANRDQSLDEENPYVERIEEAFRLVNKPLVVSELTQ